MFKISCLVSLVAISLLGFSSSSNATIVEFQTSQGAIKVNLFDQTTPKTVENFLNYIDDQHYTNSVVHRVSANFVVQGGGFSFEGDWPLTRIETNAAVVNEPVYSNVKGTIVMAKLGNDPNSATDQWFFNLNDNNTGTAKEGNLDLQNGGFTVFGQVIGNGMTVINKIAALGLCSNSGLIGIPMTDYSSQNCTDQTTPGIENFVVITQIDIIDSSEVTDANLTPTKNTLINQETPKESSGGGTMAFLSVLLLTLFNIRKKR
ncbi:MAG: peptidylprolyl isomerase [Colwellia sp.]|nr:peptidylprolyl isomerase [Colwellia sp.]